MQGDIETFLIKTGEWQLDQIDTIKRVRFFDMLLKRIKITMKY